jgi:hypothetical protein
MRRFSARGRGRSAPILKPRCHLTVIVAEKAAEAPKAKAAPKAKKAKTDTSTVAPAKVETKKTEAQGESA